MTTPKPHPIGRSLTVTPLSKTQGASMQQRFEVEGDQSDDMVSPSSCSEDGYYNRMSSRKRLYALRPKSFNFNGLLSCYWCCNPSQYGEATNPCTLLLYNTILVSDPLQQLNCIVEYVEMGNYNNLWIMSCCAVFLVSENCLKNYHPCLML